MKGARRRWLCVPCSQRADPCARSSGSRSVLSCRIIAGLRPSVRTTGAAAMTTVALCSLRRRADFLLGRKSRRSLKVRDLIGFRASYTHGRLDGCVRVGDCRDRHVPVPLLRERAVRQARSRRVGSAHRRPPRVVPPGAPISAGAAVRHLHLRLLLRGLVRRVDVDMERRRAIDGARGGGAVVRALRQPRGVVPAHAAHVPHDDARRRISRGVQPGERHSHGTRAGATYVRAVHGRERPGAVRHAPRRRDQRQRRRGSPQAASRERGWRRQREERGRGISEEYTQGAHRWSLRRRDGAALPRRVRGMERVRGDDRHRRRDGRSRSGPSPTYSHGRSRTSGGTGRSSGTNT